VRATIYGREHAAAGAAVCARLRLRGEALPQQFLALFGALAALGLGPAEEFGQLTVARSANWLADMAIPGPAGDKRPRVRAE